MLFRVCFPHAPRDHAHVFRLVILVDDFGAEQGFEQVLEGDDAGGADEGKVVQRRGFLATAIGLAVLVALALLMAAVLTEGLAGRSPW